MNFLLLHKYFPGQFRHLIKRLCRDGHRVVGIGEAGSTERFTLPANAALYTYSGAELAQTGLHPLAAHFDEGVRRGLLAGKAAASIVNSGYSPDVILAHSGWGEALFLKEVMPDVPLIGYFEYFYRATASDVGFDPEYPARPADKFLARTMNAINFLSLEACDLGITPTNWQRSHYPSEFWPKLEVVHEGIDTTAVCPNPNATFRLPNGRTVSRGDAIVTFVSRCLEPYRGFHTFMRAIPAILASDPKTEVLIAGDEGNRYSPAPTGGASHKQALLRELGDRFDTERVHFLDHLPYDDYLRLLQVSSVHVYLTYPFVLSWSMLEAMAAGCIVLGSRTAPVMEVIDDGVNGFLVDFFDHQGIARQVSRLLGEREALAPIARTARQTVIDRYDVDSVSYVRYAGLIAKYIR